MNDLSMTKPLEFPALDALITSEGAHHLECVDGPDGSVSWVAAADARYHEIVGYAVTELPTDVRTQAEAWLRANPGATVYPD